MTLAAPLKGDIEAVLTRLRSAKPVSGEQKSPAGV